MRQTKFTRFHGLLFLLSFFACMDTVPLRARCDLCYENIDSHATPITKNLGAILMDIKIVKTNNLEMAAKQ